MNEVWRVVGRVISLKITRTITRAVVNEKSVASMRRPGLNRAAAGHDAEKEKEKKIESLLFFTLHLLCNLCYAICAKVCCF